MYKYFEIYSVAIFDQIFNGSVEKMHVHMRAHLNKYICTKDGMHVHATLRTYASIYLYTYIYISMVH